MDFDSKFKDQDSLAEIGTPEQPDTDSLFDLIDEINRNFVSEVEASLVHRNDAPQPLLTWH